MGGEFEQGGMKADRGVDPFEDGAAQIVNQRGARHAVEEGVSLDMTVDKLRHRRTEVEAQEHMARVTQDHHEGHQWAHGATDSEFAEVRPVDLCLFPRQRAQAQSGFAGGAWAQPRDEGAKVIGRTGIAALAHPLIQTAGTQGWVGGQRLGDEHPIGLDERGSRRP